MGMIKKTYQAVADWFHGLVRRDRFSYANTDTGAENWHIGISKVGIAAVIIGMMAVLFIVILLLSAYTPILDVLPGYRTDASKYRDRLVESIIRIDSLEQRMNQMLAYNENLILVVEGKTPALKTPQKDTVLLNKDIVKPSPSDSVLRRQMERRISTGKENGGNVRNTINAVAPVDGIISEHFDARSRKYSIRVAAAPSSQVVAIADGTVIFCNWVPDHGHCLAIQHNNGVISISSQITNVLVKLGDRVHGNEVVGATMEADKNNTLPLFEFELWGDGRPIDPETYIVF